MLALIGVFISNRLLIQSFEGTNWHSKLIFVITLVCSVGILELLVLESFKSGDQEFRLLLWNILLTVLNSLTLLVTPTLLILKGIGALRISTGISLKGVVIPLYIVALFVGLYNQSGAPTTTA